jgi:hypothetical protein
MTTDNFCFYLQNILIQTSQTGGQQYCDASPSSIPWTWTTMFAGDKNVLLLLTCWLVKLVRLIETNTLAYLAKYFALSFACSGFSLDTPISTQLME